MSYAAIAGMPPAEMIQVGEATLEVFAAGSGKPLVLCHGWPEHAYSWRHQIDPLVEAGYHVIVPNQRGYGRSHRPDAVEDYDITALTGDLAGLLDHFGYDDAVFIGHDWGAIVVWNMGLLHPGRVAGIINLSVPFMERGPVPWVDFWEKMLGPDFYIVHFNRQPGVADAVFDANPRAMLSAMYRSARTPGPDLGPGMAMINMTEQGYDHGDLVMSEAELDVFVESFKHSGFTGGLNWYRNFNRNWETLEGVEQKITQPALMIYGARDMVPQSPDLADFVPNVETQTIDASHWIQQECPRETNALILHWLARHYPA
ncbi:MAG: alpha/beta hydrolase [Pseudomonadota bacterium]